MDRLERLTLDSFSHYMDLNEAFHAAIIDLAKSAMLRRAFQHAVSLPFASPSAMVFPTSGFAHADEALAIAKEHHRGIVEAIAKRQGTRAENLAREHAFIGRARPCMALSDTDAFSEDPRGIAHQSVRARQNSNSLTLYRDPSGRSIEKSNIRGTSNSSFGNRSVLTSPDCSPETSGVAGLRMSGTSRPRMSMSRLP